MRPRFLFLGGLHRSGTSLLFRCLREHPDVSGFRDTGVFEDEGQHLQSVYPPALAHGGPGKFGFDPRAALSESSPLVSRANRLRLESEWLRYWNARRAILLEKSPPNLIRTRFLQALFPESCFVILLRHPVVVAYATQKWSGTSLASLIEHWFVCHETFRRDRERLERVFVCSYERFVRAPQAVLDEIYAFAGLASHENELAVDAGGNSGYFERWRAFRSDPATSEEASALIDRFEARAQTFGYSLCGDA